VVAQRHQHRLAAAEQRIQPHRPRGIAEGEAPVHAIPEVLDDVDVLQRRQRLLAALRKRDRRLLGARGGGRQHDQEENDRVETQAALPPESHRGGIGTL
jgi:hypothetical protein